MKCLVDKGNKQTISKKVIAFVPLFLVFSYFSLSQSIYNKKITETQILDINDELIRFPSDKLINVTVLFNPQDSVHLRHLTEIKFILDEFPDKKLDSWAVCKKARIDSLKRLEHLNYHFIVDSKNVIIGYIGDYYCERCLSLMFIKGKKVKYWSTSISYDFIREWLKENLKDESQ